MDFTQNALLRSKTQENVKNTSFFRYLKKVGHKFARLKNMRFFMYLTLLVFLLISKSSNSLILMEPGEQKKLPSPYGEKITLSRPGLISIQEEGPFIRLKARKTGELFLDQGSSTRWIKILPTNEKIKWTNFLKLIESIPWLKWSFYGNKIYVSGSMHRLQDWKKLAQNSKRNQIPYTMNADISEAVKKDFLHFAKDQEPFKILWHKPVQVILPFNHPSLFSDYGIQTVTDEKNFLIELNLLLAETSSNNSRFFNASIRLITEPLQSIQSQFHHYKNKGMGRILTSTSLITENKKTARFFMGGEIPIPQYHTENQSTDIHFKPYGLSLNFTPQIVPDKKVHLKLDTEISEIDPSSSKGSTKNHRIQSEITIPEGQSLLLSDFQRTSLGKNKEQPKSFLIPLFSSLLSQKEIFKEKSKALIFITPRIVQP